MTSYQNCTLVRRCFRQAGIGLLALVMSGMVAPISLAQHLPGHSQARLVRYFEIAAGETAFLDGCESICLIGVPMSADHFSRLAQNPRIVALDLQRCAFSPEESKQVFQFRQLQELSLVGMAIRDEHLHWGIHSPHLTWLDLRGTCVTDQGLRLLVECRSLTYLDLRGTAVTAGAVGEMRRKRPDLEILFLPMAKGTTLAHRTMP
ncbi:MAG TPA: hypothetical protein VNQ76_05055 [Planctomicrobium sp.]|nr:hypothetical protein [Planctomicrobium sp.]